MEEVVFLGHVVSKEGTKANPQKIKAIMEWPRLHPHLPIYERR